MKQIDQNTKISIALIIVFFVFAVVLSVIIAAIITRPLSRVSMCLNYVASLDMVRAKEAEKNKSVYLFYMSL